MTLPVDAGSEKRWKFQFEYLYAHASNPNPCSGSCGSTTHIIGRGVKLQAVCLFILRKMSALTLGGVDCQDEPRGDGVENTMVSCLERGKGRRR